MMSSNEAAARGWWLSLQPVHDPDPAKRRPGDRAALARLRRCATVADAMQEPATLQLFVRLEATRPEELPGAALAAAVLAHVRRDAAMERPGLTVARQVGPGSIETPETALLKPLRFRRLMETDGWDERLTAFRRLVAIAGGALPVRDLAQALLDWSDERRRRWVFDYWNVSAAIAPSVQSVPSPSKDSPA